MSYDQDFYSKYDEYLKEPRVRKVHDRVFKLFLAFKRTLITNQDISVLDLGCGKSCEYGQSNQYFRYNGFDINADPSTTHSLLDGKLTENHVLDYRGEDFFEVAKKETPNCFVSLFSSEITASPDDNHFYYERLFREIPSMKCGMVSGFYYKDKKDRAVISETGGIDSWQTLDSVEDRISEDFSEIRMTVPCPSKFFGEDVVEVWKFFETKRWNQ